MNTSRIAVIIASSFVIVAIIVGAIFVFTAKPSLRLGANGAASNVRMVGEPKKPVGSPPLAAPDTKTKDGEMIVVSSPITGAVVTSPLTISGEARGRWYFEASFPVELRDANGNILAQAPAQAQGDWMTTDFVPFSVTLTFVPGTSATGTIVLHRDNPSGLPENDAEINIPVVF